MKLRWRNLCRPRRGYLTGGSRVDFGRKFQETENVRQIAMLVGAAAVLILTGGGNVAEFEIAILRGERDREPIARSNADILSP